MTCFPINQKTGELFFKLSMGLRNLKCTRSITSIFWLHQISVKLVKQPCQKSLIEFQRTCKKKKTQIFRIIL